MSNQMRTSVIFYSFPKKCYLFYKDYVLSQTLFWLSLRFLFQNVAT